MFAFSLQNLQYRLEYLGLRFIAAAYGAMPVEFASWLNGKIWRALAPLMFRHARALNNLARAYPEKSATEREKIARDMWENMGRVFAEAFHLRAITQSGRIAIANPDLLETVRDSGRGAVFCAAHLGNWELATHAMVKHGVGPASIYQKIKNPFVERYVLETRRFLYPGGLFTKDRHGVRSLTKYAREGGTVGVLTDLREWSGVKIDFFGALAPTTPFPAHLAQMLDLPLYVLVMVRQPGVRFVCRIERIAMRSTNDKRADVLAATHSIHASIERAIRERPEQWMWAHRRWG